MPDVRCNRPAGRAPTRFRPRAPRPAREWLRLLPIAVACLAGATPALAQQPRISNDFTASVTVDAGVLTAIQILNQDPNITYFSGTTAGQIFSAFSKNELQFNFTSPSEIVYESPFPAATGFFDWVQATDPVTGDLLAHQNGTCAEQGRSGTLWVYTPTGGNVTQMDLCANGTVPIYYDAVIEGAVNVNVFFSGGFRSGVPAQSNFVPEPASAGLLMFAAACCALLRRHGVAKRS
jgi:hypothetical protein